MVISVTHWTSENSTCQNLNSCRKTVHGCSCIAKTRDYSSSFLGHHVDENFIRAGFHRFHCSQSQILGIKTTFHADSCSQSAAAVVLQFPRHFLNIFIRSYQRDSYERRLHFCTNTRKIDHQIPCSHSAFKGK